MAFIIGLLTFVMVLDCVILILLVLIQLPKKEAGAGLAFGGSATDALFGAGSGTVLTKITKYAATGFFVLALVLSILQSNYHRRAGQALAKSLEGKTPAGMVLPPTPTTAPSSNATTPPVTTLNNAVITPPVEATNLPSNPQAATTTNSPTPTNP